MIPPPIEAVAAYMKTVPNRHGLIPLVAKGYEACGQSFESTWKVSYPLIFETDVEDFEYSVGGTGFLVTYRQRIFLVTAKHCIGSGDGKDLRVAYNPETGSFLPFQAMHKASTTNEDNDFADLVVFEAKPQLLSLREQQALNCLDLQRLVLGWR